MWCMVKSSTCSLVRQPQQRARSSGPAARSNGRAPPPRARARSVRLARVRPRQIRQVRDRDDGRAPRRSIDLHRLAVARGEARAQRLVPARRPPPGARSSARHVQRAVAAAARPACCTPRSRAPAGRGTTAAAARTRAAAARRAAPRPAARSPRGRARRGACASTRSASVRPPWAPRTARAGAAPRPARRARARPRAWPAASARPASKKSSCTPTRSTPSTSAQMPASSSSAGVRGATYAVRVRRRTRPARGAPGGPPCRWASAAARPAPRTRDGTMYSGSRSSSARAQLRRAAARPALRRDQVRHQAPVARRVLAHERRRRPRTAGCARSAASISPSSMRKPRTFTWKSARPRYSSSPSARPAHAVPRAVHPRPRRAERVGDEALRRQPRPRR